MDSPPVAAVVLAGRYRLQSLLGAGGMAEVYDGWDERLARPVAVKLLRPDLAAIEELRRRFELEARAAARLAHPNVVAVYDAGDDNGRSFIVMERLRGESLADTIGRGPVDLEWLRRLAGEVLAAVGAAHEAGIVHRDIKPANILLGSNGQAKVADFGIARVVEPPVVTEGASDETAAALTGVGLVVGTAAYLAPERAMGQPATRQSDLYSVGVVLYEALTGTKPFAGTTPFAVAAAALNGAVEDPTVLRPDADPQLVSVIGRAMALDPAHRYATAAEMAAALRRPEPSVTSVMPAVPVTVAVPDVAADAGAPPPAPPMASAAQPAPPPAPPLLLPVGPPELGEPGGPAVGGRGPRRRWGLVAAAGVAIAAVGVALLAVSPGSSTRASSTPTTATPTTTRPASSTTTPSVAASTKVDPVANALKAIAVRLSRSKSPAAADLAAGLLRVAAITDPASRAAAASDLLDQAVTWYQRGLLSVSDYVSAGGELHAAGAPVAPPPTVKRGNNGGEGGND